MFYTLFDTNSTIGLKCYMLSENALSLDQSIMLSIGKELTLYHTIKTFNDPE